MMQYDVAVVGEIYIDHVFTGFSEWPQPGEEAFARQYFRDIGGGAANTACALGRLGRMVKLIGVIGATDAAWFRERLSEFGVGSEGIVATDGNTGVTASVSMIEDRSFFTYMGENEKLMDMLRSDTALASLTCARHVHFAMPVDHALAAELLPSLRSAGCTTSLDVGFQRKWLTSSSVLGTCRVTDYFLPNEREALLLGAGNASAYLQLAREAGMPRAVIKLGSRGAIMEEHGEIYDAASPVVDVLDTTGAGDAFDAGFIDALLDHAAPGDCLRRACICGGLSTRMAGALGALPRREELRETYEHTYSS
jgi:sugar/nucleoside kinase (ribokinase family)